MGVWGNGVWGYVVWGMGYGKERRGIAWKNAVMFAQSITSSLSIAQYPVYNSTIYSLSIAQSINSTVYK
jgi:hypothetical protein